jgi:hypothetical protein
MALQHLLTHTLTQRRTVAAISAALASAAAWIILERYIFPLADLKNCTLPPSWLGFSDGQAEIVMGKQLKYCEDVFLDHEEGVAIISCDPGRAQWNTVMVRHKILLRASKLKINDREPCTIPIPKAYFIYIVMLSKKI